MQHLRNFVVFSFSSCNHYLIDLCYLIVDILHLSHKKKMKTSITIDYSLRFIKTKISRIYGIIFIIHDSPNNNP